MKICVTGGAGYIGSHAVRHLLSSGFDVTVLDNLVYGHREFIPENVSLVQCDLLDKEKLNEAFRGADFDAVMHFAAYAYVGESVSDPSKYFNNNLIGGVNLLDTMNKYNVKNIVFSSSCATYGVPKTIPITEKEQQNPINPYGFTKFAFEKMMDYYETAYDLKSISLRYFNAAGASLDASIGEWHEPETHAIPLILNATRGGRFNVFGNDYPTSDGTCLRDYIHVVDLADAHTRAVNYLAENRTSQKLNLGTGKGTSVLELIGLAEKLTGNKVNYELHSRRPGDPPELIADPSKAKEVLDWSAIYNIEDIILHAWKWHKSR